MINYRLIKNIFLTLFLLVLISCSNKPDVSGKWVGTVSETKFGRTTTMNLDLILSQTEKNVNGSLTISTPGNPRQNTTNMQGFIENKTIFLNSEVGSVLGSSIKINIQGTIDGDKIVGKFSIPALTVESIDLELNRK